MLYEQFLTKRKMRYCDCVKLPFVFSKAIYSVTDLRQLELIDSIVYRPSTRLQPAKSRFIPGADGSGTDCI